MFYNPRTRLSIHHELVSLFAFAITVMSLVNFMSFFFYFQPVDKQEGFSHAEKMINHPNISNIESM